MRRLVSLTPTVGKTPAEVAAEVAAAVARYEQAQPKPGEQPK